MNLAQLQSIFAAYGCLKYYVKYLALNDNSKNQIYLGKGSMEILNIFPTLSIEASTSESRRQMFKAKVNFNWINDNGTIHPAPHTQLILYPDYPEVRMSGFLRGSTHAPSSLLAGRLPNRILFLAVTSDDKIIGYTTTKDTELGREFEQLTNKTISGVFSVVELPQFINNRTRLLNELKRIHQSGWIDSKRLDSSRNVLPCNARNCGGFTLEAELDITPNSLSAPDYLGWEIKQFGVPSFRSINNSRITLMTPEPTGGAYVQDFRTFIQTYGYDDVSGIQDRRNFGGIFKADLLNRKTNLKLTLLGYDYEEGKITDPNGMIAIIDSNDRIAASWDYSSLILHWTRKHNQTCYIPSILTTTPARKYSYSGNILLCTGTDFQFFLRELSQRTIFYDPAMKIENFSTPNQIQKKRSQFRIKSGNVTSLYWQNEIIDLNSI